jgi:hypothetical protein
MRMNTPPEVTLAIQSKKRLDFRPPDAKGRPHFSGDENTTQSSIIARGQSKTIKDSLIILTVSIISVD